MAAKDQVKALVFDVFGTVVDWRGSAIRELTAGGEAIDRTYNVDLLDADGVVHASIEKIIYVRRRRPGD